MANPMAFFPTGATAVIAAGVASVNVAIPTPGVGSTIRVFNAGASIAFIRFGTGAQTAVATDLPLAPNSVETFRIPDSADNAAAILVSGTQNIYVTKGEGL